jgi:hypothetical protein
VELVPHPDAARCASLLSIFDTSGSSLVELFSGGEEESMGKVITKEAKLGNLGKIA